MRCPIVHADFRGGGSRALQHTHTHTHTHRAGVDITHVGRREGGGGVKRP